MIHVYAVKAEHIVELVHDALSGGLYAKHILDFDQVVADDARELHHWNTEDLLQVDSIRFNHPGVASDDFAAIRVCLFNVLLCVDASYLREALQRELVQ